MNGLRETSEMVYQPDLWGAGLKTLAMLCVVVGILILVLFIMKRFLYVKGGSGQGQLIKMLSSYHVTPKERIVLIDVAGEKIVVGVTPENITCLAKIEQSEAVERIERAKPVGLASVGFGKFLASSLKGKGRNEVE